MEVMFAPMHACVALAHQVVAGTCDTDGKVDGPASSARFSDPCGLSADVDGTLYVADTGNNCIRRVTPDGVVSTFAGGSGAGWRDGCSRSAQFCELCDVQVVRLGPGQVFGGGSGGDGAFASAGHGVGAGVGGATAGGVGAAPGVGPGPGAALGLGASTMGEPGPGSSGGGRSAWLSGERGVDGWGRSPAHACGEEAPTLRGAGQGSRCADPCFRLLAADTGNNCIRSMDWDGNVVTIAGSARGGFADGVGPEAQFSHPSGIAVDAHGYMYVADTDNHAIRRLSPDGTVITLAGNGTIGNSDGMRGEAQFSHPCGIAVCSTTPPPPRKQ